MRRRALAVATAGILALSGAMEVEAAPYQQHRGGQSIQRQNQSGSDTLRPQWCKKRKNRNKPACRRGSGGGGGGGNCHSSYPDFCIPPPPPDLDCADVNGSNFTVVGSDPHGFDGDGDGRGCES